MAPNKLKSMRVGASEAKTIVVRNLTDATCIPNYDNVVRLGQFNTDVSNKATHWVIWPPRGIVALRKELPAIDVRRLRSILIQKVVQETVSLIPNVKWFGINDILSLPGLLADYGIENPTEDFAATIMAVEWWGQADIYGLSFNIEETKVVDELIGLGLVRQV